MNPQLNSITEPCTLTPLNDQQMSTLQGGNPFYDFMKRHGFLWESASKNNHDSKDSK